MAKLKTLKIVTVLTPGMREQLAGVCIHWAVLELTVETVIATLEGTPHEVTYPDNLLRRTKKLKRLARDSTLPDKDKAEIRDIAIAIKKIAPSRDRVVHGLWGQDEEGVIHSIHPWADRDQPGAPLQEGDVRKIKRIIAGLHQRLARLGPKVRRVTLKRATRGALKR